MDSLIAKIYVKLLKIVSIQRLKPEKIQNSQIASAICQIFDLWIKRITH